MSKKDELKESKKELSYALISKYRAALMGLAILSIIFFHFTDDCRIYDFRFSGLIYYFNRYIGGSAVDIFLMLSGFGLYYSQKKNKYGYKEHLKKRIPKLLIPYLFIAIPFEGCRDIIFEKQEFLYLIKDVLFLTFFKEGRTWFWYVLLIIFCYIIFPIIFEIIDSSRDDNESSIRVMVFFCISTLIALIMSIEARGYFNNMNIAVLRFFSFVFGIYIGKKGYDNTRMDYKTALFIIASFIMIPWASKGGIIVFRYLLAMFHISVSVFLFCILLEKLPVKITNSIVKPLGFVGKYTYELYLTHVAVREIFCHVGYLTCGVKNYALMLLISVILSVILKKVTNLLLKS